MPKLKKRSYEQIKVKKKEDSGEKYAPKEHKVPVLEGDRVRKARAREEETLEPKRTRLQRDGEGHATAREEETPEAKRKRLQGDSEGHATAREEDTPGAKCKQLQGDRATHAKSRKGKTPKDRRQQRTNTYQIQNGEVPSVPLAIQNFHAAIRESASFVCTCCHRLLFKAGVIPFTQSRFMAVSEALRIKLFPPDNRYIFDGKE